MKEKTKIFEYESSQFSGTVSPNNNVTIVKKLVDIDNYVDENTEDYSNILKLNQDETVTGQKTFTSEMVLPYPMTDMSLVPESYFDDAIPQNYVTLSTDQRIQGYPLLSDAHVPVTGATGSNVLSKSQMQTMTPDTLLQSNKMQTVTATYTFTKGVSLPDDRSNSKNAAVKGYVDTIKPSVPPIPDASTAPNGEVLITDAEGNLIWQAIDDVFMHVSGDEVITGELSFDTIIPTGISNAAVKSQVDNYIPAGMMTTDTSQDVEAVKTFEGNMLVGTPSQPEDALPKSHIDSFVPENSMTLDSAQNVNAAHTYTARVTIPQTSSSVDIITVNEIRNLKPANLWVAGNATFTGKPTFTECPQVNDVDGMGNVNYPQNPVWKQYVDARIKPAAENYLLSNGNLMYYSPYYLAATDTYLWEDIMFPYPLAANGPLEISSTDIKQYPCSFITKTGRVSATWVSNNKISCPEVSYGVRFGVSFHYAIGLCLMLTDNNM